MRVVSFKTHGQMAAVNWSTLSDQRAAHVNRDGHIFRAAIILTGACNFACPYCRRMGGDRAPTIRQDFVRALIDDLIQRGLKELRLSGGEPTIISWLPDLIKHAASQGVRVAISSNGYAPIPIYDALINAGTAEFSISVDSVDPEEADRLSGGRKQVLERVLETIRFIVSRGTKIYIGMTCAKGRASAKDTIQMIASLGVTDVKIMSLAQEREIVDTSWMTDDLAKEYPLLAWRAANYRQGRDVRGLQPDDSAKCALVLDDVTIAGNKHYPCNVYFREGGAAIGTVGPAMIEARVGWFDQHDSHSDPICRTHCMDILKEYNNRARDLNPNLAAPNCVETKSNP